MLKISIAGYTIHKDNPSLFIFERKHNYPYLVKIGKKGLACNCKEYYKNKTCPHTKIVYNMLYVVDLDSASALHQQYWDLLNTKGLGKNGPTEDFRIRLESLDEVTHNCDSYVTGKYYSRYDGKYILININIECLWYK